MNKRDTRKKKIEKSKNRKIKKSKNRKIENNKKKKMEMKKKMNIRFNDIQACVDERWASKEPKKGRTRGFFCPRSSTRSSGRC
jgi:hypothetical protein